MAKYNGTEKGDMLSFKGYLYDSSSIYGLGGPDIIQLNDVFYANVSGGAGSDILQSVFGVGNVLKGGAGSDLYFSKGDRDLTISDTEGPSGVNFDGVSGAMVKLGGEADTVIDKGGIDNTYKMGGGSDTVKLSSSGGGNTVILGDYGTSEISFDWTNGGMWSSEPIIINPAQADNVILGDGSAMVMLKAPYSFMNASGRVDINLVNFDPNKHGLQFSAGNNPAFVVVGGGDVTATYLGQDGVSLFTVAVHDAGWSIKDGVTDGKSFDVVGNFGTIYGDPSEKGGTMPASSYGGETVKLAFTGPSDVDTRFMPNVLGGGGCGEGGGHTYG